MKRVIQLILLALSVVMAMLIYNGIQRPIEFNKEKTKRFSKVVKRLEDIKATQLAYKSITGKYCGNWDTLAILVKNDSFPVVIKIGHVPDSISEAEALKMGIVSRDTVRISVLDSLFGSSLARLDSLSFVPGIAGTQFNLKAGLLETGSKLIVPVFEVSTLNTVILSGMDKQEIVNLNSDKKKMNKFEGLKVGSMTEAHTNGNWETL